MFYVLYRLRASNTLKDPTNLTMLGFLYTNFEPGFWYWNCALCMRRFTLVMLMIVLYALPQFQVRSPACCNSSTISPGLACDFLLQDRPARCPALTVTNCNAMHGEGSLRSG